MYSSVKHIFFDLDNTLWDFETNSQTVISALIDKYNVSAKCQCSPSSFIKTYVLVNEDLWARYRLHQISKEELRSHRFYNTMLYFGHDDKELGNKLEEEYISQSPYQKALFPGTVEVLEELHKKYTLHIITNGFAEVQEVKLGNCGLDKYFDEVITSEAVGFNKPDRRIFDEAVERASTAHEHCVMIGDDWHADIVGATEAGIKSIYFNPKKKDYNSLGLPEITELSELLKIF